MSVKLNTKYLEGFVTEEDIKSIEPEVLSAVETLNSRSGAGSEMLGWLKLPFEYDNEEFARIKAAAKRIQQQSEVLVSIGIGGSYLGARAAIEFVKGQMYNAVREEGIPEVYFAGNNISSAQINDIIKVIGDRDFSVNVISKSGKTTEPAIAFRIFKALAEKKYGKEGAKDRIYATTDKARGALKELATAEGYETFVVPDDVGGRFSVMSAVGLLPIAAAGIDIDELMKGYAEAREAFTDGTTTDNACFRYAALRNILYRKGKGTEILVNYDPSLVMFGEWYKQLYAESEGKDLKGIFPVSAAFSTDLHSIGQFIQDGTRNLFETVVWVKEQRSDIVLESAENDLDGLNYLAGQTMQFVNSKAYAGTLLALDPEGCTKALGFPIPYPHLCPQFLYQIFFKLLSILSTGTLSDKVQ